MRRQIAVETWEQIKTAFAFLLGFRPPPIGIRALLKKDRAETKAIIEKSALQKGVDKKKQT